MQLKKELYHKESGISASQIEQCTDPEQLKTWKQILEQDLTFIKTQITELKSRAHETGLYTTTDTYIGKIKYKDVLVLLINKINLQLAVSKKDHHRKMESTFERNFIKVAKEYLPDTAYQIIVMEARKRSGSSEMEMGGSKIETNLQHEKEES